MSSRSAILFFSQLILELLRAHRLALMVQKLAVKRRTPLDSTELAGAACNIIHAIQCSDVEIADIMFQMYVGKRQIQSANYLLVFQMSVIAFQSFPTFCQTTTYFAETSWGV